MRDDRRPSFRRRLQLASRRASRVESSSLVTSGNAGEHHGVFGNRILARQLARHFLPVILCFNPAWVALGEEQLARPDRLFVVRIAQAQCDARLLTHIKVTLTKYRQGF